MTTNGSFGSPLGFTRRRLLALGAATSAGALIASSPSLAQLRLRVDEGNVQPIPMAIPDFIAGTPGDTEVARGMTQVITNNLRRSGLFQPIEPAAYIEKIAKFATQPRFPDWRQINAQALVTGFITRPVDGRLPGAFRLWDRFGDSTAT